MTKIRTKITFTTSPCGTFCVAERQGQATGIRYFTPGDTRDIPAIVLDWLKGVA